MTIPSKQAVEEAIKELPFVLSGEYSPSCNCNHCVNMPKNVDVLLSISSNYLKGEIVERDIDQNAMCKICEIRNASSL